MLLTKRKDGVLMDDRLPRFDVALWLKRPPASLWPEYIATIDAPTPFAAIETLMQQHDLFTVGYACARSVDGSLVYRCFGVRRLAVCYVVLRKEEMVAFE